MATENVRRIVSLLWEETSGVDRPANEEDGWMVMKQNGNGLLTDEELEAVVKLEEVLEEDDELHKAHERLLAVLNDSVSSLKDAPAAVKEAVATLTAYLGKSTEKAAGEPEEPKQSRAARAAQALFDVLRLGKRRMEGAEQRTDEAMAALAPGLMGIVSDQTLTKAQRLWAVELVEEKIGAISKEGE